MESVLLSIHLIVAIALVAVILLQRSEGGALGIGGGGGGAAGGMFTARAAGNLLTKATSWLAVIFIANSLALGWIGANREDGTALIDQVAEENKSETLDQLPEMPDLPGGN